jgi:hypothetical protein
MEKFSSLLVSLAVLGSSIGSALTAAALPPPPSSSTTLSVLVASSYGCTLETLPDRNAKFGETIAMVNGSSTTVTIYQRDGFWQKPLAPMASDDSVHVRAAGTYLSGCAVGQWQAPISVRPRAPGSPVKHSFRVTWASGAPAAWRFAVQVRVGQGIWRSWKSATAFESAVFNGRNGKTYFFRARTTKEGKTTDWSPSRRVVT